MTDVLTHAFTEIKARAVEDPAIDALFVAALGGLKEIDPDITFASANGRLSATVENSRGATYEIAAHNDIRGWSQEVVGLIFDLRSSSLPMRFADEEAIYQAVFKAALNQLDAYSRYASRDDAARNRLVRDGVIGLGVRIVPVADGALVQSIVKDGPADLAGLMLDDVITHVEGLPMADLTLAETRRYLDGSSYTTVGLTVRRRQHREPLTIVVRRNLVVPDTVTSRVVDGVLEIRVRSFNQRTAPTVEKAVLDARTAGPVRGLILDFRDDPGGLLDQAVYLADLFLDEGTIVALRGRHPDAQQYYTAHRGDISQGAPIAVILNGRSASASEIVATALQDNQRAVVVGTVTLGKGSVQTVIRLHNHGEIALTWSHAYTPRGALLNKLGVLPDVCTAGAALSVPAIVGRIGQGGGIPLEIRSAWYAPPSDAEGLAALRAACPPQTYAERSTDVEIANQLVRDPALFAQALHGGASQLAATD